MYSENIKEQWKPYYKGMKEALEASTVKGSFGRIGMDGTKEYDASMYFIEHTLEIDVPVEFIGSKQETYEICEHLDSEREAITGDEVSILLWLVEVNDIATDADKKACIERLSNG